MREAPLRRPAIRYHGGKWLLAPWIIEHLPPYAHSTRSLRWSENAYRHEMTDEDHRALGAVLNAVEGMVVLSGYPSELYEELYGDWHQVKRTVNTDGKAGHPGKAVEVLWLNARAARDATQQGFDL